MEHGLSRLTHSHSHCSLSLSLSRSIFLSVFVTPTGSRGTLQRKPLTLNPKPRQQCQKPYVTSKPNTGARARGSVASEKGLGSQTEGLASEFRGWQLKPSRSPVALNFPESVPGVRLSLRFFYLVFDFEAEGVQSRSARGTPWIRVGLTHGFYLGPLRLYPWV